MILKLHGEGKGVAAILKEIRSTQDKERRNYRIGHTSVYQIIAEHRKQGNGAAAGKGRPLVLCGVETLINVEFSRLKEPVQSLSNQCRAG